MLNNFYKHWNKKNTLKFSMILMLFALFCCSQITIDFNAFLQKIIVLCKKILFQHCSSNWFQVFILLIFFFKHYTKGGKHEYPKIC